MRPDITTDSEHEFKLSNGSRVQALPATTGGRSNAATDVVIDEADFVSDLATLISNARPTIDAGTNQMIVLSTVNEETPGSYFQQLCKAALDDGSVWKLFFLGCFANPNRDETWYEQQKQDALLTYGSLDPLYKHYPRTLTEALSERSLRKYFPSTWIDAVSSEQRPLSTPLDAPPLPGLKLYILPQPDRQYGVGADPAGGLSDGDDAVAMVIDAITLEQCAVLSGKIEPTTFGKQTAQLADYYNNAPINFELNNHGHAVRVALREAGAVLRMGMTKRGPSREPGWLTTDWSKTLAYDTAMKAVQQLCAEGSPGGVLAPEQVGKILFDRLTIIQVKAIESNTLKAPEGAHDDYSSAWVLAINCVYRGISNMTAVRHTLWSAPVNRAPLSGRPALEPRRPFAPTDTTDIKRKLAERGIKLDRE